MGELKQDMLFGAGRVADFVGVEQRKVYHWIARRRAGKTAPPVFDVGGQVCARISELSSWFSGNRILSNQSPCDKDREGVENDVKFGTGVKRSKTRQHLDIQK